MMDHAEKLDVFTPLGRGKVVHTFPDGTLAVEFRHGGGHVFRPDELYLPVRTKPDGKQGRNTPLQDGNAA